MKLIFNWKKQELNNINQRIFHTISCDEQMKNQIDAHKIKTKTLIQHPLHRDKTSTNIETRMKSTHLENPGD